MKVERDGLDVHEAVMSKRFYEEMFTESVKRAQEHYGSRKAFERMEAQTSRGFEGLGDAEIDFIGTRDGFYMATVNQDGQPYIQFRGGPPGFLKVLDEKTLGFADFRGNLQYISVGNLSADNRAALFLMDYAHQRRLKLLLRAEVKDSAEVPDLIAKLQTPGYKAKVERAMILHVEAYDWNCPQHITPRYTVEEIKSMLTPLNEYIVKLENEINQLKRGIKLKE
jgi:predicted pyridoxine 5'-phosphate oxidase superfamily flavin-nucleotide-binding protein